MYPLINRPSRITKTSATLIDNIFSNDIKTCVTSGLLISDISDHLPVFCCYNNSLSCHNTETVKGNQEIRLVNDRNLYNLNLSLAECFETLYQSDDVNEAYTIFLKAFLKEYNEICPMVKCFRKTTIKDKPWITKSIKNACIKKNFLYKQFIKYRCDKNLQRYKTYKNRLTSVLTL